MRSEFFAFLCSLFDFSGNSAFRFANPFAYSGRFRPAIAWHSASVRI